MSLTSSDSEDNYPAKYARGNSIVAPRNRANVLAAAAFQLSYAEVVAAPGPAAANLGSKRSRNIARSAAPLVPAVSAVDSSSRQLKNPNTRARALVLSKGKAPDVPDNSSLDDSMAALQIGIGASRTAALVSEEAAMAASTTVAATNAKRQRISAAPVTAIIAPAAATATAGKRVPRYLRWKEAKAVHSTGPEAPPVCHRTTSDLAAATATADAESTAASNPALSGAAKRRARRKRAENNAAAANLEAANNAPAKLAVSERDTNSGIAAKLAVAIRVAIRVAKQAAAATAATAADTVEEGLSVHDLLLKLTGSATVYIGLDPGIGAILTAAVYGIPGWSWSLSNKEYHARIGTKRDIDKLQKAAKRVPGLIEAESAIPNTRTVTAAETMEMLRYQNSKAMLCQRFKLNQQPFVRQLRWAADKQHQHTLSSIFQEMTRGFDKKLVVFCFGAAVFQSTMKGHMSAPRTRRFIDKLCALGWKVLEVDEYNTSQLCAACHGNNGDNERRTRLCELGGPYDDVTPERPICSNSHFVRRCISCKAVVNRDVNAARNISFLGKLQDTDQPRPAYFTREEPLADHIKVSPRPEKAACPNTKHGPKCLGKPSTSKPAPSATVTIPSPDGDNHSMGDFISMHLVFTKFHPKDELPVEGVKYQYTSNKAKYSLHAIRYPATLP
ncbi:hypothetical protein GGF38_001341 [Coemansia sp. RSA 25]|nr:hypothetical protein GGF38_001341 [Coemansia sp. RSA 25]